MKFTFSFQLNRRYIILILQHLFSNHRSTNAKWWGIHFQNFNISFLFIFSSFCLSTWNEVSSICVGFRIVCTNLGLIYCNRIDYYDIISPFTFNCHWLLQYYTHRRDLWIDSLSCVDWILWIRLQFSGLSSSPNFKRCRWSCDFESIEVYNFLTLFALLNI